MPDDEYFKVGPNAHLQDLYQVVQVKLMLLNLIELIAWVDMMLMQEDHEPARPGWYLRLAHIQDWANAQCNELPMFGASYDTNIPIAPTDEVRDDEEG